MPRDQGLLLDGLRTDFPDRFALNVQTRLPTLIVFDALGQSFYLKVRSACLGNFLITAGKPGQIPRLVIPRAGTDRGLSRFKRGRARIHRSCLKARLKLKP